MLAQEDPSLGQTLVRVWTEDYPAPPPEGVGAEVDLAADAELEALLPAGARPCSCGRCQREQQQAAASGSITSDSSSSGAVRGKEASSDGSAAVVGQEAQPAAPPTRSLQGGSAAAAAARRLNGTAEVFTAAEQCQAGEFAAAGGAGGSPSRVQLAQQQWREAMHSEVGLWAGRDDMHSKLLMQRKLAWFILLGYVIGRVCSGLSRRISSSACLKPQLHTGNLRLLIAKGNKLRRELAPPEGFQCLLSAAAPCQQSLLVIFSVKLW